MRPRLALALAVVLVIVGARASKAYWTLGYRWPGPGIVMELQLGSSSGTLIDGATSWGVSAEDALASWNPFLGGTQFRVNRDSTAPVIRGNRLNNVLWSNDVYGQPWGDGVLAVTLSSTIGNTTVESDVLFNLAYSWNSYRGNLRSSSGKGSTLIDFHRVALHEFGHVLGLDHPDDHGQNVAAIMNANTSNLDRLQSDDTAGATAIYVTSVPANRPPVVSVNCGDCRVRAGQSLSVVANASDPDGDAITYRWSAPQGTFSSTSAASTSWTAPSQIGSVTLTVTVTDTRGASATATASVNVLSQDTLSAGDRLTPGQYLQSTNNRFRLVYQTDGNLVLYDDTLRTAVWNTATTSGTPGFLVLQGDGNLVMYNSAGKAVWYSATVSSAKSVSLAMQGDGNLVLYADGRAIWTQNAPAVRVP